MGSEEKAPDSDRLSHGKYQQQQASIPGKHQETRARIKVISSCLQGE